jgi:dTMP kinase
VALLYAWDRRDAAPTIIEWLASGYYVVVDRYVYSNIAFQAAKVDNEKEKAILASWIGDLEFGYYGIPRPGVSILLNVPISFLKRQLGTARKGADRGYLQGCEDIHENSLGLQEKVLAEYLKLTEISPDFQRVECCHVTGRMLAPEEIHTQLWAVLEQAERS